MNLNFSTLVITGLFSIVTLHSTLAQIPLDGLVGYYMLDGSSVDSSGMANDGTIMDQVVPTENRLGEASRACLFDGGYIDTGNPTGFQITDAISIAAWIRLDEISTWCGIVSKWDGVGYFLGVDPSDNTIRWNLGGDGAVNGNSITLGDWVHIVATYDGEIIRLYQNGAIASSLYHDFPIVNTPINQTIGKQSNAPDNEFMGAIDEVLIYNRGLRETEVDSIYSAVVSSTQNRYSDLPVLISPNPATNKITITNKSEHKITSYILYNASGTIIKGDTYKDELDISAQPSGVYYLILNFEDSSMTKKVIKL